MKIFFEKLVRENFRNGVMCVVRFANFPSFALQNSQFLLNLNNSF